MGSRVTVFLKRICPELNRIKLLSQAWRYRANPSDREVEEDCQEFQSAWVVFRASNLEGQEKRARGVDQW